MTPDSNSRAATAATACSSVNAQHQPRAHPMAKPAGLATTWAITKSSASTDTTATTVCTPARAAR
jgi:hypothetical protein